MFITLLNHKDITDRTCKHCCIISHQKNEINMFHQKYDTDVTKSIPIPIQSLFDQIEPSLSLEHIEKLYHKKK